MGTAILPWPSHTTCKHTFLPLAAITGTLFLEGTVLGSNNCRDNCTYTEFERSPGRRTKVQSHVIILFNLVCRAWRGAYHLQSISACAAVETKRLPVFEPSSFGSLSTAFMSAAPTAELSDDLSEHDIIQKQG